MARRGGIFLAIGLAAAHFGVPRAAAAETPGGEPAAVEPAATPPAEEAPATSLDDQIVVTAGRTEQRIGDVPVKVSLLGAEELERSAARTTDGFLHQLPSFNLLRPGSSRSLDPSNQGVTLRGIGGGSASRTLVLVDGVPLNEPFAGWISWTRVPLAIVERIEVVPGGGAGAWGNQSLGGVIHLITRRPEPAALDLDLRYGSRSTVDATALASHVLGPAAFGAHATFADTDGYIEVPEPDRGPADERIRLRSAVGDARVEVAAGPGARWTAQAAWLDDHRNGNNARNVEDLELVSVRLSGEVTGAAGALWDAQLFGLRRESSNTRGIIAADHVEVTPRRHQYDNPSRSLGAGISWSRPLLERDHLVTAGVDAQWTDSAIHEDTSWDRDRWTQRFHSGGEQLLAGLFVQDSVVVGARWRLSGGARADLWKSADGYFSGIDLATGAVLYDRRPPAREEVVFHPNLGVRYRAGARVDLRASVFQSFRAPTPNELYKSTPSQRTFIAANGDLDPERVDLGLEAGFDLELPGASRLLATGFWNEISDAILDVVVGQAGSQAETVEPCGLLRPRGTCTQRQNVESLRSRGVELDAETRWRAGWRLAASYTFTDSRIVEARVDRAIEGRQVPRVPRHQGTVQVSYAAERFATVALSVRYLGDRWEENANENRIDGATVLDARISRPLGRRVDATLAVENLFDRPVEVGQGPDYAELAQPRTVTAGIRWRWRGAKEGAQ
jgi:outer membrane receptor protein involved in Fe transport